MQSRGCASAAAARSPYETGEMHALTGDTLRPGGLELTEAALRVAGFRPGTALLDVGCGLGATAAHLAAAGFSVIGVEPSETLLARAREERPQLDLRAGVAEALPVGDACVDGVFMECVLSLTMDRRRCLREARRALRPSGLLVVSDVYSRRGAEPLAGGRRSTCLGGVGARSSFFGLLRSAGLRPVFWEDRSSALASLAARAVLAHGSLAAFFDLVGIRPAEGCRPSAGRRLGYFLALARREDYRGSMAVGHGEGTGAATAAPRRSSHSARGGDR